MTLWINPIKLDSPSPLGLYLQKKINLLIGYYLYYFYRNPEGVYILYYAWRFLVGLSLIITFYCNNPELLSVGLITFIESFEVEMNSEGEPWLLTENWTRKDWWEFMMNDMGLSKGSSSGGNPNNGGDNTTSAAVGSTEEENRNRRNKRPQESQSGPDPKRTKSSLGFILNPEVNNGASQESNSNSSNSDPQGSKDNRINIGYTPGDSTSVWGSINSRYSMWDYHGYAPRYTDWPSKEVIEEVKRSLTPPKYVGKKNGCYVVYKDETKKQYSYFGPILKYLWNPKYATDEDVMQNARNWDKDFENFTKTKTNIDHLPKDAENNTKPKTKTYIDDVAILNNLYNKGDMDGYAKHRLHKEASAEHKQLSSKPTRGSIASIMNPKPIKDANSDWNWILYPDRDPKEYKHLPEPTLKDWGGDSYLLGLSKKYRARCDEDLEQFIKYFSDKMPVECKVMKIELENRRIEKEKSLAEIVPKESHPKSSSKRVTLASQAESSSRKAIQGSQVSGNAVTTNLEEIRVRNMREELQAISGTSNTSSSIVPQESQAEPSSKRSIQGSQSSSNMAIDEPRVDRRVNRSRGIQGPPFRYFDNNTKSWVVPESYHSTDPMLLGRNRLRIYDHASIRYTYDCTNNNLFCRILYPDNSTMTTNNPRVVMRHIDYHIEQIRLNNRAQPPINYATYYKNHFEPYRKAYIREKFFNKK